ncbi:MAG TPA: HAMP domain-containing sensor histidine kinase [Chitinophagaceae bacterium]
MAAFNIRSSTLRLGIFISTVIIAVILIFQLTWLKRVYNFEQKEFDHSVVKAIRGLYEDMDVKSYSSTSLNELIEKPEQHLYLANIDWPANSDTLAAYLQFELEDFNVFTDCHFGVYDQARDKYIYTTILTAAGTKEKKDLHLPIIHRRHDYIALYFPNRENYILSQMNFWITSSAVLLIVLILFSSSLYYFYKQKFLNEIQKDFIHSFTHEFKTPVSVIGLAADVLKDREIIQKPEKLVTYSDIVKYQANYLHNQIERLLQFAYTESHHLHLKREAVNMHLAIKEAVANLEPLILQKKAKLTYLLNASNPIITSDPGYMSIVIINLLDNAIKYAKHPEIVISTERTEQAFIFSVKDNGIGIEKKHIKNLFKKFYRVRQDEEYLAKGFGIGLTFVQTIVAAHKGKVTIESVPGTGTTFSIQLPLT